MKTLKLGLLLLMVVAFTGANDSCTSGGDSTNHPDYRNGRVCPINPAGEPQDFGVSVSIFGEACVEINDEVSCGSRRNLDQINSAEAGCFEFQDGEQDNIRITVDGECFLERVIASANLMEDNPYDVDMKDYLDSSVECWEASNLFYYPVCSQYLPGNNPIVIAVDTCCMACGDSGGGCVGQMWCATYCTQPDNPTSCSYICEPSSDCEDSVDSSLINCCSNCEDQILAPGERVQILRLGEPARFQTCCADYEKRSHQPDESCASMGAFQ